jgi:NAD(P)-dependent dehydrogenase (short-subunit alcohol dehydrogenase family)
VTGANRGLGCAMARQLTERGIHVAATARDLAQATKVAGELRERGLAASGACLNVTALDTITAVVERILDQHGRIDILVNNAEISDGDQEPSHTLALTWTNTDGNIGVGRQKGDEHGDTARRASTTPRGDGLHSGDTRRAPGS